MKEALIEILQSLYQNYPIFLQGTLSDDGAYPGSFFTIWNSETSDGSHYDDQAISTIWRFSINFYSTNPSLVNMVLLRVARALKRSGWILSGKGYDVFSDEATHTGRAIDVFYIEREEIINA